MRFPIKLTANLAKYIAGKKIRGEKKFPLVMMLEPLHACNLTCTGCGRIREYKSTINEMLTVEECLAAMEDCGAPIVSICGGEPMIYPEIGRLTREILARGRHIYLCTNGMFIRKRLHEFKPTSSFFWNVHLDGLERSHDLAVERDGVFQEAIEGVKAAKAAGFLVCSNTTIYKETDINEIADLYAYLHQLGVDGYMLSPAYSYAAVQTKDIFMSRAEIREKFNQATALLEKYNLMTSPIFLEYLRGERELTCTAWGNPTYNPLGWKGPCYLMTDQHHESFKEFIDNTPWEKYGRGNDPRCEDCMVHVGFEASAVLGAHHKLGDNWKMFSWQLNGKMGGARGKIKPRDNGHADGHGHSGSHGNGHSHTATNRAHDQSHDKPLVAVPPASATELVSSDGRLRVL
jgi:hopanoid biosynthesis associated radical SAM protein HpnH